MMQSNNCTFMKIELKPKDLIQTEYKLRRARKSSGSVQVTISPDTFKRECQRLDIVPWETGENDDTDLPTGSENEYYESPSSVDSFSTPSSLAHRERR